MTSEAVGYARPFVAAVLEEDWIQNQLRRLLLEYEGHTFKSGKWQIQLMSLAVSEVKCEINIVKVVLHSTLAVQRGLLSGRIPVAASLDIDIAASSHPRLVLETLELRPTDKGVVRFGAVKTKLPVGWLSLLSERIRDEANRHLPRVIAALIERQLTALPYDQVQDQLTTYDIVLGRQPKTVDWFARLMKGQIEVQISPCWWLFHEQKATQMEDAPVVWQKATSPLQCVSDLRIKRDLLEGIMTTVLSKQIGVQGFELYPSDSETSVGFIALVNQVIQVQVQGLIRIKSSQVQIDHIDYAGESKLGNMIIHLVRSRIDNIVKEAISSINGRLKDVIHVQAERVDGALKGMGYLSLDTKHVQEISSYTDRGDVGLIWQHSEGDMVVFGDRDVADGEK